MAELTGRIALITGSTSGIGAGIAEALAEAGADIALNGFGDAAQIDALLARLRKEHGVRAEHYPADLVQAEQATALVETVQRSLGSVDILVNNAGVQHVHPIEEFPPEHWEKIIALNLSAAFYTIRTALPAMKAAGWGRIINIASAHALVASPFKAAYVAAKHGLAGLTKTVALEVAEGAQITVNAICPGFTDTPLVRNQLAGLAKSYGISEEETIERVMHPTQPSHRFVQVGDIAALARFLCTEHGRSITGSMLSIDGGFTAH